MVKHHRHPEPPTVFDYSALISLNGHPADQPGSLGCPFG
jgi:hypothetical protein